MSKSLDDLKVGDTAWWTDVNRRGLHQGVVSKVGRKLVTVGSLVFRKDSGRTNDEYGHQTLVADVEAYEDRQLAHRLHRQLRNSYLSQGVTSADVMAALRLLRIEPESATPQEEQGR